MHEVSVVIPNYNGSKYLPECLNALLKQTFTNFETILVDNGSEDDSVRIIQTDFSWVKLIRLPENLGFCKAVNEGIYASKAPYVILLNNDTKVDENFVAELLAGIKRSKKRFSCQAKMIQYGNHQLMDDAGNYYNALGWAFARGKGKSVEKYDKEKKVFSCCGGAAIYRKSVFQEIGYFDEAHFAYLEDADIGYRARIFGYQNVYTPKAKVYHVGSGTSGSRYNLFKVRYSSRNNVYLIYKNMPLVQKLINLPFLMIGFGVKLAFFTAKGYGKEYAVGILKGLRLCSRDKKFPFYRKNILNYLKIQFELWINIIRRFAD